MELYTSSSRYFHLHNQNMVCSSVHARMLPISLDQLCVRRGEYRYNEAVYNLKQKLYTNYTTCMSW